MDHIDIFWEVFGFGITQIAALVYTIAVLRTQVSGLEDTKDDHEKRIRALESHIITNCSKRTLFAAAKDEGP